LGKRRLIAYYALQCLRGKEKELPDTVDERGLNFIEESGRVFVGNLVIPYYTK
jgi:hypothetical protein